MGDIMNKPNFYETLNGALKSEGLVNLWPLGSNIAYGETVSHIVQIGDKLLLISVYRENQRGMYERPIFYFTN